jgi:hypothetical protein
MLLHNLTHRHVIASKDGLGVFAFCSWRLVNAGCRVHFQPALDGAGWHRLPDVSGPDGERVYEQMLVAGSPMEAMAIFRGTS